MVRSAGLVSVCALASVLVAGRVRAEGIQEISARSGYQSSAIVASFLQGDSPELSALEGSFATSTPTLAMPQALETGLSEVGVAISTVFLPAVPALDAPNRLLLARPRSQDEVMPTATSSATSKKEPVTRRAKARSGPDALEFSRAAFPMVVGPALADLAGIRPMVGPVVGVRPAYIKPASFE